MTTPLAEQACVRTGKDAVRLDDAAVQQHWLETPMYAIQTRDGMQVIERTYTFDRYADGIAFVTRVGTLADAQDHHPQITVGYKKVTVEWYTHSLGGLHLNDFIMAARTDAAFLAMKDEQARTTVGEASAESFPASDPPGWIGSSAEPDAAPSA